jgi:hypothetical protein
MRLPQVGATAGEISGLRFDMFQQHFPGNTKFALAIVFS